MVDLILVCSSPIGLGQDPGFFTSGVMWAVLKCRGTVAFSREWLKALRYMERGVPRIL